MQLCNPETPPFGSCPVWASAETSGLVPPSFKTGIVAVWNQENQLPAERCKMRFLSVSVAKPRTMTVPTASRKLRF